MLTPALRRARAFVLGSSLAALVGCSGAPPPPAVASAPPPQPTAVPIVVEHLKDDPTGTRPPPRIEVPIVVPTVAEVKLDNGVRAWLIEDHTQPLVSFAMSIATPSTGPTAAFTVMAGLIQVLPDRAGRTLSKVSETQGSRLIVSSDDVGTLFQSDVLSEDFPLALAAMTSRLREGKSTPALLENASTQVGAYRSHPLGEEFLSAVFPSGHALAWPDPDRKAMTSQKPAEIDKLRSSYQSGDRTSFAVFGDITPAQLKDALTTAAGAWPKPKAVAPGKAVITEPQSGVILQDRGWRSNVSVTCAFPVPPTTNPDAPLVWIATHALALETGDRAAEKISEARSGALTLNRRGPEVLIGWSLDLPRSRVATVLEALRDEWNDVTSGSVDLGRAREHALRSLVGGRSTYDRIRALRFAMTMFADASAFTQFLDRVRTGDAAAVATATKNLLPKTAIRIVASGSVRQEESAIVPLGFASVVVRDASQP